MFKAAQPKILFCTEATSPSLTHTKVLRRLGELLGLLRATTVWSCVSASLLAAVGGPTFENSRTVLLIQKAFLDINVTALLEPSQSGAVASLGTDPCEKLDPKAVDFDSCDLGSVHSSAALLYSLLCCGGGALGLQVKYISQNPLLASSIDVLLIGCIHGRKVPVREKFHPILTLVWVTAVKTTSDQRCSVLKWYPAACSGLREVRPPKWQIWQG